MSRSYSRRRWALPNGLDRDLADHLGVGCSTPPSIRSWHCIHFPGCPQVPDRVVAAELRRRGWPGYRVRAWLAEQHGSAYRHEETAVRRAWSRSFRRRATQAVRNADFSDATDAPERWRRTSGWLTW